jgi:septal ring factor EnvC (AmiA/AmiB activator)
MKRYSNSIESPERLSFQNLLNKEKKNTGNNNRLQSSILVNSKDSFDDNNKLINSLNEEILGLKKKADLLYKRDKDIKELKKECETLNESKTKLQTKCSFLEKHNDRLETKVKDLEDMNSNIENIDIYEELVNIRNENNLLKKNIIILKNRLSELETYNYPSEKVTINIHKLKDIINKKLNVKNELLFNEIIKRYKVIHNGKIDKKIIEKIIHELI